MSRIDMIDTTIRHAYEASPMHGEAATAFYAPSLRPEFGPPPTAAEIALHLYVPLDVAERLVADVRALGQEVLFAAR